MRSLFAGDAMMRDMGEIEVYSCRLCGGDSTRDEREHAVCLQRDAIAEAIRTLTRADHWLAWPQTGHLADGTVKEAVQILTVVFRWEPPTQRRSLLDKPVPA